MRRYTQWHLMVGEHVVNTSVITMYSLMALMQQMLLFDYITKTFLFLLFHVVPVDPCNLPHTGPFKYKMHQREKNLKELQFTTCSLWFELHCKFLSSALLYYNISTRWRFFYVCYYHPILCTALCHATRWVFPLTRWLCVKTCQQKHLNGSDRCSVLQHLRLPTWITGFCQREDWWVCSVIRFAALCEL